MTHSTFYIVYAAETGRILRGGRCAADAVDAQALVGEIAMPVAEPVDDTAFRVVDGALQPIPESPGEHWTFDPKAGEWIEDRPAVSRAVASEALDYLASTDWYVARAVETGEPMPDIVKTRRALARKIASRWRDGEAELDPVALAEWSAVKG